jgi:hypothetical protein
VWGKRKGNDPGERGGARVIQGGGGEGRSTDVRERGGWGGGGGWVEYWRIGQKST